MRRWTVLKLLLVILVCAALWALVAAGAVCIGSTGKPGWPKATSTLASRSERVIQASIVGAALAGAGVAFQAVLRNALADPYLIGIASGAALGSYLWRLPMLAVTMASLPLYLQATSQQSFTFVGGISAAMLVLMIAGWRGRLDPTVLVLVGVILNTLIASIMMLIYWLLRGTAGAGSETALLIGTLIDLPREYLIVGGVVIVICMFELFRRSGRLNLSGLHDDEAQTLGMDVRKERWVVMLVASLMTATAVALSGPIGFVGLICPHLCRLVVGSDHRRLLPASAACGAALLVMADAAARYLNATGRLNTLLPVGLVTSLLGGPFFLMLLLSKRDSRSVS